MTNKIKQKEDVLNDARELIGQTVGDMQSSLGCNNYSLEVLSWAQHIAVRRGEKTKAKILGREIRKMEKLLIRNWHNENNY